MMLKKARPLNAHDDDAREPHRKTSLADLVSITRPYRARWIWSIILSFAQAAFFMQFPLVIKEMTVAIGAGSSEHLLASMIWLLVMFAFFSGIMFVRLRYCSFYIADYVIYDLRMQLMNKILQHSFKLADEEQSGDLVSVTTSDVNMIRNFLGFQLAYFVRMLFQLCGIVLILLIISPPLFLVLAPIFPGFVIGQYFYKSRIHPITYKQRTVFGSLTSRLAENISGVHLVRAFATEAFEYEEFNKINASYATLSKQVGKLSSVLDPYFHLLMQIGRGLVIGVGGFIILQSVAGLFGFMLSLDETITFIPALGLIIEPLVFSSWFIGEYGRVQAAYDRIREVLEKPFEIREKPDAVALPALNGDITFRDVTFSYRPGNPVVKDVNFHVKAGTTIALLGATGSGKTTITSLLARFYEIDSGAILLDEKWDIRDVTLDSYRKQLGIVAQEPFLFQQSIRDNITHGLDGVPDDKIWESCRIAKIDDFIKSKSDGLDTEVGERGVTVSGGQKQRLTLARAILRDPRVLILDAATSSVDVDTEYEILMNLKKIFPGRTVIIITQRLSTVKGADYIYLFDAGKIAEQGTHEQLIALDGKYSTLYRTVTHSPASAGKRGQALTREGDDA